MDQLELSIIIVAYNTKDFLIDCIESIEKTTKTSYEIVVVDNASSDDGIAALREKQFENLTIIENRQNFGFSKANNIGVKESSGRFVLFLNPDTVVHSRTIDGMVEFMKTHKDAGAATCFLELPNGKLDDAAHRGFPTPWRSFAYFSNLAAQFPKSRFFSGYTMSYENIGKTHEIDALAGAFMLVRREVGEEVGWWDEDFFWYGDDLDFCYRLRERGWKIYFVPEFKTLHYKGVSGGIKKISKHLTTADEQTRKKAIDARFEAMKIFYDKHYKNKYPAIVRNFVLFGIILKRESTKLLFT